jgi:hypothetical protein
MHVDIPTPASGISRFPIAPVDARTGSVINRATLTLQTEFRERPGSGDTTVPRLRRATAAEPVVVTVSP